MHNAHQWSTGELLLGGISALVVWLFLYAIIKAFEGKKPEEIPPDMVAESLRVVGTPMPLPGGRWGFYETTLKECAAPLPANHGEPHIPQDPQHRATCQRCQREYGQSKRGIPHVIN